MEPRVQSLNVSQPAIHLVSSSAKFPGPHEERLIQKGHHGTESFALFNPRLTHRRQARAATPLPHRHPLLCVLCLSWPTLPHCLLCDIFFALFLVPPILVALLSDAVEGLAGAEEDFAVDKNRGRDSVFVGDLVFGEDLKAVGFCVQDEDGAILSSHIEFSGSVNG